MPWQLRHEGSPKVLKDLTLEQIVDGLRDGQWESTDEVLGPGDTRWRRIEAHPKLAQIAEELETPPPMRQEEPSSIDMNALIDVCLVLLIFYMTTVGVMVQKSVPLPMTRADAKGIRVVRVDEVKSKMIRIDAYHDKDGKPVVRVENQTVKDVLVSSTDLIDADKVREAVRPFVKGEDHKTEVLLNARDISWENTIQIMDGARAAGVQVVHHLLKK